MLRWTGIACALAACYRPAAVQPCTLACETDADCPNGLSCGTDSRCFSDVQCFMRPDAGVDVAGDGASVCLGSWVFQPCVDPGASGMTLEGTIDTTSDPLCIDMPQTTGSHLCAIVGSNIMVRDLRVIGNRPLALVALVSVDIVGPLDASSHVTSSGGPHATDVVCTGGSPGGLGPPGGGGAGGSFHGTGGAGGAGGNGAMAGSTTDTVLPSALAEIRAGCAGTAGGSGSAGGLGGGALAIVAGQRITISVGGSIDVSGAAAAGPPIKGGGGGGGAGGMVVFDAPVLTVGGPVLAFGASGASGGSVGSAGEPGLEPDLAKLGQAAAGPIGANGGGSGGDGSGPSPTLNAKPGMAGATNGGGGGGGGGAGYIIVSNSTASSLFAPPPIRKP